MKNRVFIKTLGTIVLTGTIIVTAGVAVGAAAQTIDGKTETSATADVHGSTIEKKTETKEVSNGSSQEAQLISRFETKSDKDAKRDKNLEKACEKLSGFEIKSGETFSFIESVGPFIETEGYVDAPVIVSDTQMGEDIGGGVCQVSTTLYNAALAGNMEIVERKRHSFPMNYVSVGMDSAISTPEIDLKLKNNSEQSIFVFANTEDGKVTIELFGVPLGKDEEVKIQSAVTQEIKPEGAEVRFSDTLEPGEKEVLQEERIGYEVAVYREHYKDSKLINKEVISEDTYPAVQRIVVEGTSNTSK